MNKTVKFFFGIAVVIMSLLSSCAKENGTGNQAQVKFINASIDAPAVDVTFDGVLLVGSIAFPYASDYVFVTAGNPVVKIFPSLASGTSSYASGNVMLQNNVNYSVIISDSVAKMKTSVIVDTVSTPSSGYAKVRFLNLSPNASSMDVIAVSGTLTDTLSKARSFNDQNINIAYWGFINIPIGTYTIKVNAASTATTLFTMPSTLFADGKIYTIVAKGVTNATAGSAQALGGVVFLYN
jgi:hypothetical protein